MRVLVTGGAGFIGSHVCEKLVSHGACVRVLDNFSSGKRDNLRSVDTAVELMEGDIRDRSAVDTGFADINAVIHLAAVASVQASVDDPLGTHQTNFDGTLNLLEAARRYGVTKFLYASSAAVYGDTTELPVSEETSLSPLSPYAADKLSGEYYLWHYVRKHGLAATAFRFFNIYGPRQDPGSPYSGVISIFVDRMRRGLPVTIFGDGRQTRDFVYVGDLAALLVDALYRADLSGNVFNIGTGQECSLLALLDALESAAGRRLERQHAPARIGDVLRSCADVHRLRSAFGAVPATSIGDGLAQLLACRQDAARN